MSNRLIDVPIENEELIEVLNKFTWFFNERRNLEKFVHITCEGDKREDFIGDNVPRGLDFITRQGEHHEGFPDSLKAYSLDSEKIVNHVKDFQRNGDAQEAEQQLWLAEATKNYSLWNQELIELLCVRNNALASSVSAMDISHGITMQTHPHITSSLHGVNMGMDTLIMLTLVRVK